MEVGVPYWRKVWKTLASGSRKVPKKLITGVLNEVGDDLCKGIKVYDAPFNENACKSWLMKSSLKDFDHAFERFFLRLCKSLNLKGGATWSVLCNYLLYEFHGKLSRIKQLATYEPFATKLIEAIWHFYTSERMYLLKTLRFVLENFNNLTYVDVFPDYMKKVTWNFLWGNIIAQLEFLIAEINVSTHENTIDLTVWAERNAQEQLEVALTANACMEFDNFTVDNFIVLMTVFMKNDFGRISPHISGINIDVEVFDKICCVEIGAFLIFLDNCWTNDKFWLPKKDALDKLVSLSSSSRGHDIIMFSWSTLQAELYLDEGAEYDARYSKQFDTLLNSGVMSLIRNFVSCLTTFICKPVKLILKSTYSFMNHLCNAFNDEGFISLYSGTYEIIHELLKDDDICANFLLDKQKPIYRLLEFSLKFFPYNFKGLTLLMHALIEKGYREIVFETIKNLNIYTENYLGILSDDSTIFLRNDYFPIYNSRSFSIPEGTVAKVFSKFKKTLLLYEVNYDYYTIFLSHLDGLTSQVDERSNFREHTFEKVFLGYKLIAAALEGGIIDTSFKRNFLKQLIRVHLLFSKGEHQNLGMMNTFLQSIEGAMFSGIADSDKFWPPDFIPKLKTMSIAKILSHHDIFTPSALIDLLRLDEDDDSHVLLFTYGNFIRKCLDKNVFRMEIQLPGVVYVLMEVFPKYKDYRYNSVLDSYRVANLALEILWSVLKRDQRTIHDEEERFMFNFCLEAVLTDSYVLKGYCEFFKTTLFTAQRLLEKETNWEAKDDIVINKFVTLFLHTFLMLIKHNRHQKNQRNETSLFEKVILRAPLDRLNTVKVVTAFADYSFNPEVQNLAIRILENLAMDSTYPMFGPMDLEPFQLQSFFLDKLRDPVESDEMKLAIIDLILTCVEYQPGLTNAFFNINILETEDVDDGESVMGCMLDFIENIEESKIAVDHPLLRGILSVIHKVWDTGNTPLIEKIVELKNFWPTLVKPLHHQLIAEPKYYGYIFGILAQEFFISRDGLSEAFVNVIQDLLATKNDFLQRWCAYLVKISSTITTSKDIDQFDSVSYTGEIFVLYAWKLFVNYGQLFARELFQDDKLRMIITENCLAALLSHFEVIAQLPCIKFWSELYATCLNEWSSNNLDNVADLFIKMQKVLRALTVDYKTIDASSKQAILTSVAIMLKKLDHYANGNSSAIRDILEPLGTIVRYEFYEVVDAVTTAYKSDEIPDSLSTWLLILSIANKVLLLRNTKDHWYWFEEVGFLKKVLWCVGPFLQSPKTLPLAKFALKSLIIYSQSPFAYGLLRSDKNNFFKETVPPIEYVQPPLKAPLLMREWWVTYAEIIKLMNFLIMKFRNAVSSDVFTFLNFHDDTIIATLELARLTADPAALNLICCVLMFCNNMLMWRGRWMTNKENYFVRTVHAIRTCISGISNLILRPKSLAFVSIHNFKNFIPSREIKDDLYLDIYNMVLEAITLAVRFFAKCQQPLLSYTDCPEYGYVVIELEKDFYIPRFTLSVELNIFTYGGILCILHFLCKAYTKIKDNLRKKAQSSEKEKILTRRTLKDVPSMEKLVTMSETIDTPTKELGPYLALILAQIDVDLMHDSISSVQRFASSCFILFDFPWFLKLNPDIVKMALEMVSYFVILELASDLHSPNISQQMKEYMMREMGSEMQFFNDFVRKNMQEKMGSAKIEHTLPRKRIELERLSAYMNQLFKERNFEVQDEFSWVLNHIVQDWCQLEDDN